MNGVAKPMFKTNKRKTRGISLWQSAAKKATRK